MAVDQDSHQLLEKAILASRNTPFLGNGLLSLNRVENAFLLHLFIKVAFFLFQIALDFRVKKVEGIREIRLSPIQSTDRTPRLGGNGASSNLGHHPTQIDLIATTAHERGQIQWRRS